MTAPQPGDAVRVVISGTVTDWAQTEALIASVGGTVERLTIVPPPLKLGDDIASSDDFQRAPLGTVARSTYNGALLFKFDQNYWIDTTGDRIAYWSIMVPLTIEFLPDAA